MRSSRSRPNSQSGFTLIELLVVMLILGILAAIAIPAFSKRDTKVVTAEVCSVTNKQVVLPKEAEGPYALEDDQQQPITGNSYRFTVDTKEQTITSVDPVENDEKVLRC